MFHLKYLVGKALQKRAEHGSGTIELAQALVSWIPFLVTLHNDVDSIDLVLLGDLALDSLVLFLVEL
jgi:hypothetical protein